jgi:Tfp pilus assembly protein PilO
MQYSRYAVKLSPVLKNKAVTTYTPSLFSLIAIMVFAVFAIRPTVKNILSLQETINQQKQTLTQLQAKSKSLSDATNSYNSIPEETRLKLINLLPNSTNLTCLINDVNNRAVSSGVTVSGLQVQSTDLKGKTKCILDSQDLDQYRQSLSSSFNLKEIGFTVSGQGGFNQLSDFLASFNTATRLDNIETVIFNKSADSKTINLILNGKTYYYK